MSNTRRREIHKTFWLGNLKEGAHLEEVHPIFCLLETGNSLRRLKRPPRVA